MRDYEQESCGVLSNALTDEKPGGKDSLMHSESPTNGSTLNSNQGHQNKYVFWCGNDMSDKCRIIREPEARKEFLRKGNHFFPCLNQGCVSSKSMLLL